MKTLEEIMDEIEIGVMDAQGDYPHISLDDLTRDVARSIVADLPQHTAAQVLHRLGIQI